MSMKRRGQGEAALGANEADLTVLERLPQRL
jgi:hypothetical protein